MSKTDQKATWKDFFCLIKSVIPSKILLTMAIALNAFSSFATLLIPLFTKNLVDNFVNSALNTNVILIIGILFILQAILSGISIYLLCFLGQSITESLRLQLWRKLVFLPIKFYDEHKTGQLVSQMTNDTTQIKNVITSHIITIISGVFSIIGSTVVLFMLDTQLTLLIFASGLFMILLVKPFGTRMYNISRENQEKNAKLTSLVSQTLSEIRLVKSSNAEEKEIHHVEETVKKLTQLGMQSGKTQAIMSPFLSLISLLMIVSIVGYGGIRVAAGELTTGNLVAFILYVFQIITPMVQLFSTITQVNVIKGASERILSTLNEAEEKIWDGKEFHNEKFNLNFDNVSFSYEGETQEICEVSFTMPADSFTAIVGPSGAGKTTLFSLIERYYKPQSGKILLNNAPVEDYSINEWRRKIGYVSQDTPIIDGTIKENIIYGVELEVSEKRLKQVIKTACLSEFIDSLPNKYNTYVGERGVRLSGGQKQRIGIARAILREPQLLLLDESTSNMDSILEKKIQKAFINIMKNRTTVAIAHRLSTIRQADQIIFLDRGKITGIGTHEQLFKEHSLYQEYIKVQFPKELLVNVD
jgi:ABC-type multidrug transport system, ATPase and permease components